MDTTRELHHLFWTSGWDSTFRLVQLLLFRKRPVQPHYLIDPQRKSTGAELVSHRRIKEKLVSLYPETEPLLLPVRQFEISDLPEYPDIEASYQKLRVNSYLGNQYAFLARYTRMMDLTDVELSIQGHGRIHTRLSSCLVPFEDAGQTNYRMDPAAASSDEFHVFGRFAFPLLNFTKQDTIEFVERNNLLEVMKLTWFCHDPLPDFTPCGVCNPCSFAIKDGMAWRIPLRSRIHYYLPGVAMLRRMATQNPRLYRVASRLKKRVTHSGT